MNFVWLAEASSSYSDAELLRWQDFQCLTSYDDKRLRLASRGIPALDKLLADGYPDKSAIPISGAKVS